MKIRRYTFILLAMGFPASVRPAGRIEIPAERPNILFVYLDDFGWKDAGFMGCDFYETPHLDALAGAGLVFTDAYSCAANCAPARACLLSGQYTPRHGIFNVGTKPRGDARHRRLQHVAGVSALRPDITTWAECLQDAGYRTGMFGKWHLADSMPEKLDALHRKLREWREHVGAPVPAAGNPEFDAEAEAEAISSYRARRDTSSSDDR